MERPAAGLIGDFLGEAVAAKLKALDTDEQWLLRTYTLMPDHFHLVVTLREGADLSSTMRLFKGPLSVILRTRGLKWQKSFYDHRIRVEEELLPTFLYVFLNPYRDKLISAGERWPWYFCAAEDWAWFGGMTDDATPFPEWLR